MGIPVSIVLVAAGAILAFAVNKSPNGVDVHTVGWILLIIGIVGLLLTLLFWDSWWGGRYVRRSYAGPPGPPARRSWYGGYWPRRNVTYVEEEGGVPPEAPPGPPAP